MATYQTFHTTKLEKPPIFPVCVGDSPMIKQRKSIQPQDNSSPMNKSSDRVSSKQSSPRMLNFDYFKRKKERLGSSPRKFTDVYTLKQWRELKEVVTEKYKQ